MFNNLVYIRYSRNKIVIENIKKINTLPKDEINRILHLIDTFCGFIVPTAEEYTQAVAREKELMTIREENRAREKFITEIRRNAIIAAAKAEDISAVQYMIFHC